MKYLLLAGAFLGVLGYAWFGRSDANVYAVAPAEVYQALRSAPVEKGNGAVFGKLDTSVSGNGDSVVYWNASGSHAAHHCEATIAPEGADHSRLTAYCDGGGPSDGAAAGMVSGMKRKALIEHIDATLDKRSYDARLAQGSRRRFSLRSVAVVGSALAAALVALLFFPRRTAEPLLSTQTELTASGGSRAATASVGGIWKVSVDRRQEVRVWRNQKLVLRCGVPSDGDCQAAGPRRTANVPLEVPGEYRAMVLTAGAAPLAEPVSFDDDARLARENGASYAVLEPIVVY